MRDPDPMRPLEALIERYGYRRESSEARLLAAYLGLLAKWNVRVNLTADTRWPAIRWLFEEALWAAVWYSETTVRHLDIGSGAGFPAVPLRILKPEMRLRLVESRTRRAAFLETVAAELKLTGMSVACCRAEEYLRASGTLAFDIVSWKGLRLSREALRLIVQKSLPGTRFWLFHGRELPLEDPASAAEFLQLVRREAYPGRQERWLSIYAVSRETSST